MRDMLDRGWQLPIALPVVAPGRIEPPFAPAEIEVGIGPGKKAGSENARTITAEDEVGRHCTEDHAALDGSAAERDVAPFIEKEGLRSARAGEADATPHAQAQL